MNHPPFRLAPGWYILVGGVQIGPWPIKGYAMAGYQTELRRFERKQKIQNNLNKCDINHKINPDINQ